MNYPRNYVSLIGLVRVAPQDEESFAALAARSLEPTREKAGCLSYHVARDVAEPGLFHVVEDWASRDALQAHVNSPEFAKQLAGANGLEILSREMYLADAADRVLASSAPTDVDTGRPAL